MTTLDIENDTLQIAVGSCLSLQTFALRCQQFLARHQDKTSKAKLRCTTRLPSPGWRQQTHYDPLARYHCTPPCPTPARGHTKQPHTRAEAQPYTAMTYNMPMASAPTRHSVGLRQWMQPSTAYVGNSERAHPGLSRRAAAHGAGPDSMNIALPPDALLCAFPW